MADTIAPSVVQIMDANGNPVPGAKAYFYDTGTSTPRTVYSNLAGSTPHASPVVADANGVLPPIYATVPVKMDVTTSSGGAVPGYPVDPANKVQSVGFTIGVDVQAYDTDLAALAGNTSNGLWARTGSGAGAARTLTAGSAIAITNGDGVSGNPTVAVSNFGAAGQVLSMNDAGSAVAARDDIVLASAVNTTSGTAVDISTAIPSWVKRVTVIISGVSTNGTSRKIIQLGSGSYTTSGYTGGLGTTAAATVSGITMDASGFSLGASNLAADVLSGIVTLHKVSGNIWIAAIQVGSASGNFLNGGGGTVTLAGTLDRVRITTVGGTDAFDAGSIAASWE